MKQAGNNHYVAKIVFFANDNASTLKISTEESFDFLDCAIDEVTLSHAPALLYFALSSYFSRFALESIGRILWTEPPK